MQDYYETLSKELAHVYWIGGSPCAGKSSIAETLVAKFDLHLYKADEAYFRHEKIVDQKKQPVFYKVARLSSEELWMRPIEQQVSEEITLYREEFPLILEELLALPKSRPILAEGAALLPECVAPLLFNPKQALWIVPNAEFQLYHYVQREWARDVVKNCTRPEQAFHNWMQRDIRFAEFVAQEVLQRGMHIVVVDGTHTLEENTMRVEQHFLLR